MSAEAVPETRAGERAEDQPEALRVSSQATPDEVSESDRAWNAVREGLNGRARGTRGPEQTSSGRSRNMVRHAGLPPTRGRMLRSVMRTRGVLQLLERVSRSFYLTIRVLPKPVRLPIGLAYLLARSTDSVADTSSLPAARRRDILSLMGERIASVHTAPLDLGEVGSAQQVPAERELLECFEALITLLEHLEPEPRDLIRTALTTIISGQRLDLARFGGAGPGRLVALQTDSELDDYTFRVAGCVGQFWTNLCRTALFPRDWLDFKALIVRSIRFGKGLQLVNILRDLPADLRQGRCYLPLQALTAHGLVPADLLDPANMVRFRPLYTRYLDLAEEHLAAGWVYTTLLPQRLIRLRLACAWPALIGIRTLSLLRTGNVLNPSHRIKVSRTEVRSILARSALLYPLRGSWQRLFDRVRQLPVT